ncbi:hypothetical protein ACLK1S_10420 [Escherichia coli]
MPESVYRLTGKAKSCLPRTRLFVRNADELLQPVRLLVGAKKNRVKMTPWWHCIYRNMLRIVHSREADRRVRRCNKR